MSRGRKTSENCILELLEGNLWSSSSARRVLFILLRDSMLCINALKKIVKSSTLSNKSKYSVRYLFTHFLENTRS